MYQKDYILRMIEMLGDLLAALSGRVKKGEYRQASAELERIYHNMLKEDASYLKSLPADQLTAVLCEKHNYTTGHLEILAELFNSEAELAFAQGDINASLELSGKSLLLFRYIDKEQKTFSVERIQKMETITARIDKTGKKSRE